VTATDENAPAPGDDGRAGDAPAGERPAAGSAEPAGTGPSDTVPSGADPSAPEDSAANGSGRRRGGWRESLLLTGGGVVIALLLHAFVIGSFWIPSESMENTLIRDDRVIVNRLSGMPERGDIVVFKGWDGTDWIKRVIGVPGDTVKCCDAKHRMSVNGVLLDEDYLYTDDYASGDDFEVKVPAGRLWVMGDHRTASMDSRAHLGDEFKGTISADDVVGRALAIYWPFSRAAVLSRPEIFEKVR
jgi:signal peptidase I